MASLSTWRKIQAASGLVFALYLSLHFLTHYSTLKGWDNGLAALARNRKIYHIPIVELIFFGSLLVHMTSNVFVYLKRTALEKNAKDNKVHTGAGSLELKAHRLTGYVMAFFIFGHIFATRGFAWLYLDRPHDYDYTIITLVSDDLPYIFSLYLIIFGMAGNWHMVYGIRSALATLTGHSVHLKPFPLPLKGVALVMHLLMIASVLAISGYFYPIDRERASDVYKIVHAKFFGS